MTLFDRVKEISSDHGMSLQETAKKAGLGINSIYGWKTKQPSTDRVKAVAEVLNVSVDYLLGNEQDYDSALNAAKNDYTESTNHAFPLQEKALTIASPSDDGKTVEVDLDKALADKGVAMRFNGRELSDKAKKGILDIINLIDGDEE